MKYVFIFLLCAAFAHSSYGRRRNPLKNPSICGRPVCEAGNKFKYAPGTKQQYDYTIDILTQFEGHGSDNTSKLHINSKVILSWMNPCEGVLRLTDVVLKEAPDRYDRIEDIDYETPQHDNSPQFSQALQEHPLRFSFEDGAVTELCPNVDELTWVLNMKKGILSMLHNTMERLDVDHNKLETDIHGVCPTTYRLEGAHGTSLVIQKSKDLLKCDRRHKLQSVIRTSNYRTRQDQPKVLPIVQSSLQCELSVDHNVYNQIECRQSHKVEPFKGKATGAVTTTTQKLKLLIEDDDIDINNDNSDIERRTTLLYDHFSTPKPTVGELKSARWLIKQMCQLGNDNGQEMFSDVFSRYIRSARLISYTALHHLYLKTGSICELGRKHFLDALPYLGSTASLELMTKLMVEGKVSGGVAEDWLLSIALISSPEEAMLVPLRQLLDRFPNNGTVILAVSSLARSFCLDAPNCDENEKLYNIIELLTTRLEEAYSTTEESGHDEIFLIVLKAISNIGVKTPELDDLLMDLIRNERFSVEIRLAGVEAYRRFDCEESVSDFLGLFSNKSMNSEVRIRSYLQIMRCPNYRVVEIVRDVLEVEEVNQVGSFVWSHLNNLVKSSMPKNLEIQTILYGEELGRKFSSDMRKFSTNFAGSVFFNRLNVGGCWDGNVVFSTDSYVPRSGMFNLSLDMFGEEVNLVEVTGRAEGLEGLVEGLFGPGSRMSRLKERLLRNRFTRSLSENEVIKKGVGELPNVMKEKFGEPKVSVGVKVFGNEVKYWSFVGKDDVIKGINIFNPIEHFKTLLSGRKISYEKTNLFLDTSMIIPTSTGFPLSLNLLGTSSVNMKLFGYVKGVNFTNDLKIDLVGDFRPSATVNIVSSMVMDAYYASTGIKIRTNAHTSTAIEGFIKMRGINSIIANFSLPKDKTEIFSATSELIVDKDNEELVQTGTLPMVSETKCSSPDVYKTTGLTMCWNSHHPNITENGIPILASPFKYALTIPKADPSAKNYLVEYNWGYRGNDTEVVLSYTTPGSVMKKHFLANLTMNFDTQNITLQLKSSTGIITGRSRYRYTPNEKYVYIEVDSDGKKSLDFGASLTRKENKNVQVYSPRLYIAMNNERIVDLHGTVRHILKVLQATQVHEIDLNFKTENITSNINGRVTQGLQVTSANFNVTYTLLNYTQEFLAFDLQYSDKIVNKIRTYQNEYRLESSEFPKVNSEVVSKIQSVPGRLEAEVNVSSGINWKDPNHKITFTYSYLSTKKTEGKKLNTIIQIQQPIRQIDWKTQFIFDQTGPSINTIGVLQVAKNRTFSIDLYLHAPRSNLIFLESKLNVTVPTYYPLLAEVKIHEKVSREFDLDLKGQWFNGYDIHSKGRYLDRSTILGTNHYLKMLVKSNRFDDINLSVTQLQDKSHFKMEVKAEQNSEEYSLLVKHSINGTHLMNTLAQVRYGPKLYYVTSAIELLEYQQIVIDCHIDRWRDISAKLKGIAKPIRKEVEFEIKWDVNRDPDQKLSTIIEYHLPEPSKYQGKFQLTYPGRSATFLFDFNPRNFRYNTFGRYIWNYEKFIQVNASSRTIIGDESVTYFSTDIGTSFENWEVISTKFQGGYRRSLNNVFSNLEINWGDSQSFSSDFNANYSTPDSNIKLLAHGTVQSTLPEIPSIQTIFEHTQNYSKLNTQYLITYKFPDEIRENIFRIRNVWERRFHPNLQYYSGETSIDNPFYGYKSIVFRTKFNRVDQNEMKGIISLDLDVKKYMASVKRYWNKISDNMLVLNVSTPTDDHKVSVRLGISGRNRHAVAEIKTSTKSIGLEVTCQVHNTTDYELMINLATPIENMKSFVILAKRKDDRVEYKTALNRFQIGFAASWHYEHLLDFDHSYKIYTPIEGYEENSITAKLILIDGIDAELSLQITQIKIGAMIKISPKSDTMKLLGFEQPKNPEETPTSWTGIARLDTHIYQPIKAYFDFDKKDTVYTIFMTFNIPQGDLEVMDELNFVGPTQASNRLKIKTPFVICQQITSNGILEANKTVDTLIYNLLLELNVLSKGKWVTSGVESNFLYQYNDGPPVVKRYRRSLIIRTPFKTLPYFKGVVLEDHEGHIHNLNLTLATANTTILTSVTSETTEGNLDLTAKCQVDSSIVKLPLTRIHLKKNCSEEIDDLNFTLESSKHGAKLNWHLISTENFNVELKTNLPLQPLENLHLKASNEDDEGIKKAELIMVLSSNSLNVNSTLNDTVLSTDATAMFLGEEYIFKFDGTLVDITDSQQKLLGVLTYENFPSNVTGVIDYTNYKLPKNLKIDIVSSYDDDVRIRYNLDYEHVQYNLTARFEKGDSLTSVIAHGVVNNKYDWTITADVTTPVDKYDKYHLDGKMLTPNQNKIQFDVSATSPLQGLGLTEFSYEHLFENSHGLVRSRHSFADTKGELNSTWKWLRAGEDVKFNLVGNQQFEKFSKKVSTEIHYVNTDHSFSDLDAGGEINVNDLLRTDGEWIFGGDMKMTVPTSTDLNIEANLKLPAPNVDTHSLIIKADKNKQKLDSFDYLYGISYSTSKTGLYYGADAGVTYAEKGNVNGSLKLCWGRGDEESITNVLVLKQNQSDFDWYYGLKTSIHPEETFKTRMKFKKDFIYYNASLGVYYPGDRSLVSLRLNFSEMSNMEGFVNVSTPFKINYGGGSFDFKGNSAGSKKKVVVFWPNDTAVYTEEVSRKNTYANLEDGTGVIKVEIPLKTRHTFEGYYEYQESPESAKGLGRLKLNGSELMNGKYNGRYESKAGFDKEVIDVELGSDLFIIGVDYINEYEYNAPGDGLNYPMKTVKQLKLVDRKNKDGFKIDGKFQFESDFIGDKFKIEVNDPKHSISLSNDYKIEDQVFEQNTLLRLTPNLFLNCDVKIINKTQDEITEEQEMIISLSGPKTNITGIGTYVTTSTSLVTDGNLTWSVEDDEETQENKLRSSFNWEQTDPLAQNFELRFSHPSFETDVVISGNVQSEKKTTEAGFIIEYSLDETKKLYFNSYFNDTSQEDVNSYEYKIWSIHPDTNLDMSTIGKIFFDRNQLTLIGHNDARYKRKIFATEYGTVDAKLDIINKFYDYKKETRTTTSTFFATGDIQYPVVFGMLNRTFGEDVHESGNFTVDFKEKYLRLRFNMTEDGDHSFNIDGKIPDARSASIVVWRDYDDIRLVDLSYLLNLNHSRLVVSRFRWRPELSQELSNLLKTNIYGTCSYIWEELDNWKKYIRFEIVEEMSDLWDSSKPHIQGYLDDIKALKALKKDLGQYEDYFNKTYYENGFYIHHIVEYTTNLTEKLTKKSKEDNIPIIVTEFVEITGKTAVTILKGISKIIDDLKESYDNIKNFWNRVLNSDPMELFKAFAESFFDNTDKFLDSLLESFGQKILEIAGKIEKFFQINQQDFLANMEPILIEIGGYINRIWYHTIQDFINYLSERIDEIIKSPYFVSISNYFSSFDEIYKDYIHSDFISFLTKYLSISIDYINRKLFPDFNITDELEQIIIEIKTSWDEMKKNRIVDYILEKIHSAWNKIQWIYNRFEGSKGIGHFFNSIQETYTDSTMTALQAENKYRIPKTKFVYDTKIGLLLLEQKLPMSWHAFNETPKFSEIPEVHALGEIEEFFITSNTSFWTMYYDYRPYSDVKDWLPPFDSTSLIIGGRHFITFDRKYFKLNGSCSYLLSSDFIDSNYSLSISYDQNESSRNYKLHLFTKNGTSLAVNIKNRMISIGNVPKTRLPFSTEDINAYQESDILTVESKLGYRLRCNFKFEVCAFDLNGWYFGKTAGLFGTFNNEPSDDFLTSSNSLVGDSEEFASSWKLTDEDCVMGRESVRQKRPEEVVQLCENLFGSKMSPFQSCYQKVDAGPFKKICLAGEIEDQVCTAAAGYVELCRTENTPLRIPDTCVKCKLLNGTLVNEGTFVEFSQTEIPKSTDIVFIVELKECNKNLTTYADVIIPVLNSELNSAGVKNNKYALVTYGGPGIYNRPRSLIHDQIFTSASNILSYFTDLPFGNGSRDIFEAIDFASGLDFRPGVSKTFILLPCSTCDISDMIHLDYAALHQLLREYDIKLHILMNGGFQADKRSGKINKILYGIDHERAFTKKDAKVFKGDMDLRKHVRVSKSSLGLCVPLALETNGTVFTTNKLDPSQRSAKMFSTVFGRRVATTAVPGTCQTCECNAHDHGTSYMECFPCEYPSLTSMEQEFDVSSPDDEEDIVKDVEDSEEEEE